MSRFHLGNASIRRGHRSRRFVMLACLGIALSSCSSPVSAVKDALIDSEPGVTISTDEGTKLFRANLSNAMEGGISFRADTFQLDVGENHLDFQGASVKAKIDGLSLHGLGFEFHAPVSYNGLNRRIDATLVDEELYLALDSDPAQADYEFRYKVGLEAYDVVEGGSSIIDPVTGGVVYYEFGKLDWIIDDILDILSSNQINTSLSLQSGNDLSFSSEDLLSSLESIEESSLAGSPYFLWDIEVNGTTYPVGLRSDSNYALKGIDFPAKTIGGTQSPFVLPSGNSLQISASVEALAIGSIQAPSDAADYRDLVNSVGLFEQIAHMASSQKLTVTSFHQESDAEVPGLLFHHHEDEITGDKVSHKDEINEDALLSLSTSIDIKGGTLNAIDANIGFASDEKETDIALHIIGDEDSRVAYLNANHGCMKVRTPVSVLDGLGEVIGELASDADLSNKYLARLLSTGGKISEAIDAVKASEAMTGIDHGRYDHILSMLTILHGGDDTLLVKLSLEKMALSGSVELKLNASNFALVEIRFSGISVAGFSIEGGLRIQEYVPTSFVEDDSFSDLDHIPSLIDQLSAFASSDSLTFNVEGYYLKGGTTAVANDPRYTLLDGSPVTQEGFTFKGNGGFNLKTKQGFGSMTAIDRKADYLNEHHLSLEIEGPELEDEDGNSLEKDEDDSSTRNNMLFSYSSENNFLEGLDKSYYGTTTEPSHDPLYGRFSVHSLNSLLELFEDLSGSDDRFSRLTGGLFSTGATTLLSTLTEGQYVPLLTAGIIRSFTATATQDEIVLSKKLLGTATDIYLTLKFNEGKDGPLTGLSVYVEFSGSDDQNSILFLDIGLAIPERPLTDEDVAIADLRDHKASMTDYSSLKTLIQYLLGSANLGVDAYGISTYHLTGTAKVALGSIFSLDVALNFYITVEGVEVQVMGSIDAPTFLSVNQPTLGLSSGHVYTDFYFHTSGTDEGEFYFRRTRGINPESNRDQDEARVSFADFTANILDWILGYFLNLSESMMENFTSSDDKTEKSLHGEDLILSFGFNSDFSAPTWDLSLGMGALSGSSVLGDLNISISGKSVDVGGVNEKTLASASGSMKIASVLTVSFALSLANVSGDSYVDCWGSNDANDSIDLHYLHVYTTKVLFITTTHRDVETESGHAKAFYESRFFSNGSYVSAITSLPYTEKPTIASY